MKTSKIIILICLWSFSLIGLNAQIAANPVDTCLREMRLDLRTGSLRNVDNSISNRAILSNITDGSLKVKAQSNMTDADFQWLKFTFTGNRTATVTKFTVYYSVQPSPNNDKNKCYISQTRMVKGLTPGIGTVMIDDPTDLFGTNSHTATPIAPFISGTEYKTVSLKLAMSSGDIIVINRVTVYFDCPVNPCLPNLVNPKLGFAGKEAYQIEEKSFMRYKLKVTNYSIYPDNMFEVSPDLPPCGANVNAVRTWVDIFDQDGNKIYGFCSLGRSSELTNIWFSVPKGGKVPARVMIKMIDRRCNKTYVSNWVSIPQ